VGCGTGALAFLLLARDPQARGVGVEIQPRLASLARRAIQENRFGDRFALELADARALAQRSSGFDLVVTNPPFQPLGRGDLPPDPERSIAHHEVSLAVDDWLDVATRALVPQGRLGVIHLAARTPELLAGMRARGLAPVRLRAVHPRPDAPATRVLIEARRGEATAPPLQEPPLVVHAGARYSPEVLRFLGERA
jgi:tRNA1(Val) A37 N6-methylase TrmN6